MAGLARSAQKATKGIAMNNASQSAKPKGIMWARGFIALVLVSNLAAAIPFVCRPERFVGAFELAGVPGRAAVMGVGLLFVMWQVPYAFALAHPGRHWISVVEAVLMQLIGLGGETWLLSRIPLEHANLRGSILRFILFDALGALCLLAALGLVLASRRSEER